MKDDHYKLKKHATLKKSLFDNISIFEKLFPIEIKYRDVKIIKQLIINKLYKWYTNGYI